MDFKISDEVIDENEVNEENDISKDDVFYAVICGKQITKTIKTSRGDFTVKYPKEKDRILIERLEAQMRNGVPYESFSVAANTRLNEIATLDVVVIETPEWFKAQKTKRRGFGWADIPDTKLVDDLYMETWQFFREVQEVFTSDTPTENTQAVDGGNVPEAVGGGLFSGVKGGSK